MKIRKLKHHVSWETAWKNVCGVCHINLNFNCITVFSLLATTFSSRRLI